MTAPRAILFLLLGVLIFAAGGVTSWWWLTQRAPRTASLPTPPPDFGPLTPSPVTASPEAVPSAPAPSPQAEASAAPPPSTAVASSSTPGARRPRAVGRIPPGPAVPLVPPASGPGAAPAGAHSFVLGTTIAESLKVVGRDLDGFDAAGVGVKRAPKTEGTIELVLEPRPLKAGDAYAVKVFLKNEGRSPIDVGEMKVSMIVDGKWSTRPLPSKARQIAPQQRALLEELPGVWKGDVKDWAVEAVVTSKQQDVYRNRLTWK
jgi:hypothetical protein